jgi:hypothetical protein
MHDRPTCACCSAACACPIWCWLSARAWLGGAAEEAGGMPPFAWGCMPVCWSRAALSSYGHLRMWHARVCLRSVSWSCGGNAQRQVPCNSPCKTIFFSLSAPPTPHDSRPLAASYLGRQGVHARVEIQRRERTCRLRWLGSLCAGVESNIAGATTEWLRPNEWDNRSW